MRKFLLMGKLLCILLINDEDDNANDDVQIILPESLRVLVRFGE